jgi:sporulation protein YlmC with PRC-barrel domain
MLKRLMMTTAAAALVVGSAVAQTPAPDAPKAPPAVQKTEPMAPGAQTGSRQFVTQQSSDQWLATKFKGTDVIGSNNEKIGDVNDLLIDQNGRIVAYIVGVGGFLGIGERQVAIPLESLQMGSDGRLTTTLTKDEIGAIPIYDEGSYDRVGPDDRVRAVPNQ